MTERFENLASSDLDGAISNSDTSIVLTSGALFPASGPFRITIDPDGASPEIVLIASRSGNTLTVASGGRGNGGTSAQAWGDATTVIHAVTKQSLRAMIAELVSPGDITPEPPGSYDDEFEADSLDGSWSWVNQGSSSLAFSNGCVVATAAYQNTTDSKRLLVKTSPTGSFTAMLKASAALKASTYRGFGLVFRNSSSGKFVMFAIETDGTKIYTSFQRWTNATTFSANLANTDIINAGRLTNPIYLRLRKNGSTIEVSWSADGKAWSIILATETLTFISSIDQVGIVFYAHTAGTDPQDVCLHWFRVTEP